MNTTTETKTARKTLTASEVFATIEAAPLPAPTGARIRCDGTTAQAAAIRGLLKSVGIKGVRVVRSHAGWSAKVDIRMPRAQHTEAVNWYEHNRIQCPACSRERAATEKLEQIVLAAFPDCGNRSDLQSDYFDYVFSVCHENE